MEKSTIRAIEREAAEALLDNGVSTPIAEFRLPFFARTFTLRATMRRPTLAAQIALAKEYTTLGVDSEELWDFNKQQQMEFLATHGKAISRMIALCFCRSPLKRRLLLPFWAYVVRHYMPYRYMIEALRTFVSLMGTDPFMPIIRSAETLNPMTARLSHTAKGS